MDGAAAGRSAGWVVLYPESGTLTALPSAAPPPYVVEQRLRGKVGTSHVSGRDADEVERRVGELAEWYAASVRWAR